MYIGSSAAAATTTTWHISYNIFRGVGLKKRFQPKTRHPGTITASSKDSPITLSSIWSTDTISGRESNVARDGEVSNIAISSKQSIIPVSRNETLISTHSKDITMHFSKDVSAFTIILLVVKAVLTICSWSIHRNTTCAAVLSCSAAIALIIC